MFSVACGISLVLDCHHAQLHTFGRSARGDGMNSLTSLQRRTARNLNLVSGALITGWWFEPLWKTWVNWDDEIPNLWENKKWQPNHQPDYICKMMSMCWLRNDPRNHLIRSSLWLVSPTSQWLRSIVSDQTSGSGGLQLARQESAKRKWNREEWWIMCDTTVVQVDFQAYLRTSVDSRWMIGNVSDI